MSLSTGPTVTDDSINTFSNKAISAETNLISDLEVDNFKSGVLDTALGSPADHSTIPSAKITRQRINERLEKTSNLSDLSSVPSARDNLSVYSKSEVDLKIKNSEDINDTFGNVSVSRDALGNVTSIITTMPGGNTKSELLTYNSRGDLSSIQTLIPHLNINRTENYLYDASGDFIGISI